MKKILLFMLASISSFAASAGWTELPGTKLTTVCPTGTLAAAGSCGAVVYAWSGATADTQQNRLLIWGGGHNDYYGNEVYAVYPVAGQALPTGNGVVCSNSAAPAICRLNNPTSPNAYPPGATPLEVIGGSSPKQGEPNAANGRHTYNGLVYNPTANVMLSFGGGPSGTATPLFSAALWALSLSGLASNPDGANWTRLDTTAAVSGNAPSLYQSGGLAAPPMMFYDPAGDTYYFLNGAATGFLWSYKYSTNSMKFLGNGTAGTASGATPVVYPPTNTVYFFGSMDGSGTQAQTTGAPHVFSMSYASGSNWTTKEITSSTNGCTALASAMHPGMAYDSATQKIVGWPNFGGTVYIFDPSTNTCTPQTFAGGPPDSVDYNGTQYTTGTYGRFQYLAALDAFVLVNSASNNAFLLSLGSGTTTTPPPPVQTVPVISSFTASTASITSGSSATLTWATTGASSVSITPAVGSVVLSGTATVNPTSNTTYTLTATNSAGSATATASISVTAPPSGSSSPAPAPADTLTITNAGTTATNYPVQFGRPFVQGEFPAGGLPQAFLGSTALPTQVDVKSHWPDGSLKHAIISFILPTFNAGQAYTISLKQGTTVGNTPLTQTEMLAAGFNFDAQIQLTNGGATKTASARKMLTNGDYMVWASGPIATTIVLANHAQTTTCGGNAASVYDFGFDSYCAFRPEFEATFWPQTNQVFVRYVGEIADTQQLENVVVSNMVLTLGNTSPTTVYTLPASKSPLTMSALTRWTQSYWLNGTPPVAGYNHNLAYLAATQLIPNFDQTKVIPATQVTNAYNTWLGLPTANPYDPADLMLDQTSAGGRRYPADEVGPLTGPETMWLYTGDYRAQIMATRYAELAAAWPVHWREGNSSKFIDRARTISGLGHWMSVSSRPSYCIQCGSTFFNYSGIAAADKVTPVGTASYGGWVPDVAHQPDWMPVYLLTGDYFFLEEDWAWASYTVLHTDGSRHDYPGRGPTGVEGHIPGNSVWGEQVRGTGWGLRNRVEVAAISPEGSPEQSYYDLLVKDTLAAFEGERNITNGAYNGTPMWTWGNQFAAANYCTTHGGVGLWCANAIAGVQNGVPTAIHFWVPDGGVSNGLCAYPIDTTIQGNIGCTSPWMVQYVIYALGRAKDVGYPSDALLSWIAPWEISQVTDPTYNPYLAASYRQPTVQANGQYYTTWAAMLTAACSSTATGCISGSAGSNAQTAATFAAPVNQYSCAMDPNGDGNCSGAFEAGLALAFVADQPNGATAWNWINTTAMSSPVLNSNPKWAIVPRTTSTFTSSTPPPAPPPTTVSACDLNGDGLINSADVQVAINQSLGTATCGTADLQHNGHCDVVDVQRVINASMGGSCVVN